MWMTALHEHQVTLLPWAVVLAAAWVSAMMDLCARRIPNWLTGPILLGGLVWAWSQAGWLGLGNAVAGCLVAALPFVILFLFAGGGAGDAKMMGAIGACLGLINAVIVVAGVALMGGLLAIGFALATRRWRAAMGNLGQFMRAWGTAVVLWRVGMAPAPSVPRIAGLQTMPYGVAIFAGVCLAALGAYWRGG